MKRLRDVLTITGGLLCLLCVPPALAQTGTVLGFGDNSVGQLGDNTTINRSLPTPTFMLSAVKAIACGTGHTLALDAGGVVWAWGNNYYGQLGTGDNLPRTTPVVIWQSARAIAAGDSFSLMLDAGG